MSMILFLIVGAASLLAIAGAYALKTKPLGSAIAALPQSRGAAKQHFPLAVQTLVLAVQAGELVNVIQHTNVVSVAGALILLAMVLAMRSGTEITIE